MANGTGKSQDQLDEEAGIDPWERQLLDGLREARAEGDKRKIAILNTLWLMHKAKKNPGISCLLLATAGFGSAYVAGAIPNSVLTNFASLLPPKLG